MPDLPIQPRTSASFPAAPGPPSTWPDFRPHALLRGGNRQTLAGAYLRCTMRPLQSRRWRIEFDDGDLLALHDTCPRDWSPGDPWVLLAHGLCGCHQSRYMLRMAHRLELYGVRSFRMDLRGFGDSEIRGPRTSHAGRHDDVRTAVRFVQELCPGSPGGLVGYSMGGNLVLGMLGEDQQRAPECIRVAAAVAPPVHLSLCASTMRYGSGGLYGRYFAKRLMRDLLRMQQRLPHAFPRKLGPPPRDLWDFDDRFTARINGFAGAEDYYAQASSLPLLDRIQRPTLVLASRDDPLIPFNIFEPLLNGLGRVTLLATDHGGHLGYVAAAGADPDFRWMDWRLLEWLLGHLGGEGNAARPPQGQPRAS